MGIFDKLKGKQPDTGKNAEGTGQTPAGRYQLQQEARRRWIGQLEDGDYTVLSGLYMMAAEPDNPLFPEAMGAIARAMERMDVNRWLAWDSRFGECTSMEWYVEWSQVDPAAARPFLQSEEDYLWLLRLGTLHPNGYYREKCLRELAAYKGELGYILLRTNDWAGPVRELAEELAKRVAPESDFIQLMSAIPFLEKAGRGGRRDTEAFRQTKEKIRERIVEGICHPDGEAVIQAITHCNLRVRQGIYRLLFQGELLPEARVEQLLAAEGNVGCCNQIIRYLLYSFPYDEGRVGRYLRAKSGFARKCAVECKYEHGKDAWDGLEEMLLDPVRGVREYAAYILQKRRGMDIGGFYRKHMQEQGGPGDGVGQADEGNAGASHNTAVTVALITGLGEYGTAGDVDLIRPWIQASQEKVVRAALTSLSRLMGQEGGEVYWTFLFHEKAGPAKSAYRAVVKGGVHYGAKRLYDALQEAGYPQGKYYLIKLLLRETGWKNLPYLLRLYRYQDKLGELGLGQFREACERELFCQYIQRGRGVSHLEAVISKRSLGVKVSPALAQEIREVLADGQYGIPERVAEDILFDMKYVTVDTPT